jgi:hypothetical protein
VSNEEFIHAIKVATVIINCMSAAVILIGICQICYAYGKKSATGDGEGSR